MTTTVKFCPVNKSKFIPSLPVIDGLRFSCAGEGCVTKEKCARWNRIYETLFLPQQFKTLWR